MSLALLFSGQGSQNAAMMPWLEPSWDTRDMCTALGVSDWRNALQDPRWAQTNLNAQVVLTTLALAAWKQLSNILPKPEAVAGYSVGELAAFSVAGVLEKSVAVALSHRRAHAMDKCAARQPGGMLAVSGLPNATISELCSTFDLSIAIDNGATSVVLGGGMAGVDAAHKRAIEMGGQCTRLAVSLASHSPLMNDATKAFANQLLSEQFSKPRIALFSNACDRVHNAEEARVALADQISQTVRWSDCMQSIAERQVDCVLEIGPCNGLANMWAKRYPQIPARSCDDFRDVGSIAAWVDQHSTT